MHNSSSKLAGWLLSLSMVGKKTHQLKTHFSFSLEKRVPEDNLYRQLKEVIDWGFLYEAVAPYYGTCGHHSGPRQLLIPLSFLN